MKYNNKLKMRIMVLNSILIIGCCSMSLLIRAELVVKKYEIPLNNNHPKKECFPDIYESSLAMLCSQKDRSSILTNFQLGDND